MFSTYDYLVHVFLKLCQAEVLHVNQIELKYQTLHTLENRHSSRHLFLYAINTTAYNNTFLEIHINLIRKILS